jgi:hypothetical protein
MASLSRFIAAAACALCFPWLEGCAYVNPYIAVHAPQFDPPISKQLPNVQLSVNYLDSRIADAEAKHLQSGRTHRSLNLLTFGLATGAAVAPVYRAHRDLIAGLSMSAATSFTGNALFTPADGSLLYYAAVEALSCIKARGSILSGAVSLALTDDGKDRLEARYRASKCASPDVRDAIDTAYSQATSLADRAVRSDALAAAKLHQAGVAVLGTLNKEIDNRAPRPEAIFAAAKAISAGVAPDNRTKDSKASAGSPLTPFSTGDCSEQEEAAADAAKDSVIAGFNQVAQTITTALDMIEALDTSCLLGVPQIGELALDKNSVTVSAGSEIYVRISGGRPPYRSLWDTDPGANGVSRSDVPDFVVLRGATQIGSDGTYKLTISDSSAVNRTKQVTVTAKKSGGS